MIDQAIRDQWQRIIHGVVGAPFRWGGRGPVAYDCWGLVLHVRDLIGRPIPREYAVPEDDTAGVCRVMGEQFGGAEWRRTTDPAAGDVVAMSVHRVLHHVGIFTPFGILHTTRPSGAILSQRSRLRAIGYGRIEYYQWAG